MYVDGFVIPVPKDNRDAYTDLARQAAAVFLDHGATRVVECWGDDVPDGVHTSFPMAVKLEAGEVACVAWIEYPDKATRDACHKASTQDPRLAHHRDHSTMPFDVTRMIFGGFMPVIDERR